MNKRSVTLLETLIAIVLLLALGALIFPSLMDSLDERTFESAADVTNEQLMMARAHAQATGSPVEVTYNADKSQVQVRLFTPWLTGLSMPKHTETIVPDTNSGPLKAFADEQAEPRPVIGESWACRELGHGVRMSARPPAASSDSSVSMVEGDGMAAADPQVWGELGKGQDIRLAVFMPDGSALLGDPVWLNDDKGRCGILSVNPWSGLPFFQRISDSGDETVAKSDSSKKLAGDENPDEGSRGSGRTNAADRDRRARARSASRSDTALDGDTIGSQE